MTDDARESIGRVLGRVPSGVFIITAGDGAGRATGMLASWVQQASFEPPMVTVAVNRQRYLHDWLARAPRMVANLVGEGQSQFLRHFARGFEPDQPAFEGFATESRVTGVPVLVEALGYLEGEVAGALEAGDHLVYLLKIVGAGAGGALESAQPMVHVRKNGFRY